MGENYGELDQLDGFGIWLSGHFPREKLIQLYYLEEILFVKPIYTRKKNHVVINKTHKRRIWNVD